MTITADVNALTGTSFSSGEVYAAVQAAFRVISGYVKATIAENDNEQLDSAALIMARKILERGRISQKQKIQDSPADYVDSVISKEVKNILDNYLLEEAPSFVFSANANPQTHTPGKEWRT